MINQAIIDAWDIAPKWRIHPTREHESEDAYWASGVDYAKRISAVLPAGCHVLDFGCGDGRVALALADLGFTVTAADSSPRLLADITDDRIQTVLSNGTDLDIDPVDAVVCIAVVIHYDYESGKTLMGELAKVVKPGGVLVVDAPSSDEPVDYGGWIGVTTWNEKIRDDHLLTFGMHRVKSDLLWPVYRKAECNSV